MINDSSNPFGTAIDLKAAADALPSAYSDVAGMIRSLSSAHSIRMDIEVALDMLTALDVVLPQARAEPTNSNWASNCALALINSAVVMYSRATKTSSNHRGSINFIKEFNDQEKALHAKLVKLRDDSIAHFGPGEDYGGPPWQREGVFLPIDDIEDMRVMTASRRVIMQGELQNAMKKLIHRCLMICERITQKRNSALVERMNEISEDAEFLGELGKFRTDLIDFFGSEEARNHAISGMRRGRRSGVVDR